MSSPTDTSNRQQSKAAIAAASAKRWGTTLKILGWGAAAVGLILGGVFVVHVSILAPTPPQQVKTPEVIANPEQITGTESRIIGVDRNQRPFEIRAKTGQQDKLIETLVHLQSVDGDFERPSGAKLDVTATAAKYDTKTKALELEGDVVFGEGNRFKALMDKAALNMDDMSLQSRAPVKVDMQGTAIQADSLSVSDNGNRILFRGGVKARFVTNSAKTGDGG